MALDRAFYKKYGFNLSNTLGSGCKVMCITGGRSTGKTYTAKRQAIKFWRSVDLTGNQTGIAPHVPWRPA